MMYFSVLKSVFAFSNKIYAKLYANTEYVSPYFKIQNCLFRVAQRRALLCNNAIMMAVLSYVIPY